MKKDVLHMIEENMPRFSKGQRRIAAYILSNYDKAAFMTASRLGELVGVSESTVVRFAALLDPHCTQKLIAQRRDCLHADHFPSSFNCVNTGCQMIVIMKSAGKAAVQLIPNEDSVPFDLSDPDVRYLVEAAKRGGHSAQCYDYFQKYRFALKREAEEWHIDEVSCDSLHGDRWRRDYYF